MRQKPTNQAQSAEIASPAPPAGVVASGPPECGMVQDTWSGLPHWSCTSCGFETLEQTEADRHRDACRARHGG